MDLETPTVSAGRRSIDHRLWITLAATVVIVAAFWLGSRYPVLNEKALMGDTVPIAGLAFDTIVRILPGSALGWEIVANALNWLYTNWRGMVFGLLFGACLLTGLPLLARRSFRHPLANAALGGAIGMPLGVCTNCAAPIALGLVAGGMARETALAALIASPTLNAIVVTMAFTLLPFHLALLKLVAMAALILLGVPLLVRLAGRVEIDPTRAGAIDALSRPKGLLASFASRLLAPVEPADGGQGAQPFHRAVVWFLSRFLRSLAFLVLVTVPLMLVAALLGSVAVTLLPFQAIVDALPVSEDLGPMLMAAALLAVLGALLPVPIAFDVIVVAVLIQAGLEPPYAAVLLLCLAPFSIYSLLIVGRATSWRLATSVLLAVAVVAVAGAVAAIPLDAVAQQTREETTARILKRGGALEFEPFARPPTPARPDTASRVPAPAARWRNVALPTDHARAGRIVTTVRPPSSASGRSTAARFTRLAGPELGLTVRHSPSVLQAFSPFSAFHGIAAGDFDGDDRDDIVLPRDALVGGVAFFRGIGNGFAEVEQQLALAPGTFVNAVALVDLDNDEKLDLYLSTRRRGAHVYWNRDGRFRGTDRTRLPNGDASMVGAAGFGDLDGDGRVDMVLGNWFGGYPTKPDRGVHAAGQRNRILWNEGERRFSVQDLEGSPGETLTVLLHDIDADGDQDIMVGDDFQGTDKIYLNQGARAFRPATRDDGLVPWMALDTMSIHAGDIDNDLRPEIYVGQIAMPSRMSDYRNNERPWRRICHALARDGAIRGEDVPACFRAVRSMNDIIRFGRYGECGRVDGEQARALCAVLAFNWNDDNVTRQEACRDVPARWPYMREICELAMKPRSRLPVAIRRGGETFDLIRDANLLFRSGQGTGMADVAADFGVSRPGWTWNAKFADLDQDGLLDLYVLTDRFTSSKFYRNVAGKRFEDATREFGLLDHEPAFSSVLLDVDEDGDLDIVRSPSFGFAIVFRNDGPSGQGFWVSLRDRIGNSLGLGARVELTLEGGRTRLLREVRASGGFNSFDPTRLHFGVPEGEMPERLTVRWADGATTRIGGLRQLPRNAELRVRRRHD